MVVRKLAKIVVIDDVFDADNSDNLSVAKIGGWQVVVGRDSFNKNDKAVFVEIDSLIPVENSSFKVPEWVVAQSKIFDNTDDLLRYRVKTAKLRGNLSQGMLFKIEDFGLDDVIVGSDVTDKLNVLKYEPLLPVDSKIIGPYPELFAVKSDSERIQNISEFYDEIKKHDWVITEKIDGTSITVVNDDGTVRLASRNYEIVSDGHVLWSVIDKQDFLNNVPSGHAVQGELFGEGIQNNTLGICGKRFLVFNEYVNGKVLTRKEWSDWSKKLQVPVIDFVLPDTVEELLEKVNGVKSRIPSFNKTPRLAEGYVFHEVNGDFLNFVDRPNFKVISNKFLLKNE